MKPEELADELNGIEYCDEISKELIVNAKQNNLVIVYGASDDLMELRGAIDEEISCYDGGFVYLNNTGLIINECSDDSCPYFLKAIEQAQAKVEAQWCKEDLYSWTYKTGIPHSTFDILEDGGKYCRGVVFSMGDIK